MDMLAVGKELVALCRQGKNLEAIEKLYSPQIISVEASEMQGMSRQATGIDAVRAKNQWWIDNHVIHGGEVVGPMPHGTNKFACLLRYDVTFKVTHQRMTLEEIAVYQVENGKIVHEEFYYSTPE